MQAKEEAIFSAAIELHDPDKRQAYVVQACGDDLGLRGSVEALLRAHDSQCLLDVPVIARDDLRRDTPVSEGPGSIIGHYKLLETIGEGGMAVVYMAEQQEPVRREVALKIIKLGMDTKQVIARFEAERQALAMMDHPNIAKVLDAGATETGRPYFVMELVQGVSITEYCDQNNLSPRERLTLFIQICNAVQHAHQKGMIHRDIKPSNVMVTMHDGTAVPKVIDFGIAKAINQRLTEKTLFTRYAHIIGTPAYMSPEQAELSDLDVDTRSDIYSLGVLLYELLTGTTPFGEERLRTAGYVEMQRVICEEEPTKPSTKLGTLGAMLTDVAARRSTTPASLRKVIRGDLDWIIMRALEKQRIRRYETAHALAEDIQRHLNDEPVQAAAPSLVYLARKFACKHRAKLVSASGMIAAVLLALALVRTEIRRRAEIESMASQQRQLRTASVLSAVERLQAEGRYGEALTQLEIVLQSDTVAPKAQLLRGQLLNDMGRLEDAEDQLRDLLAEQPEVAGAAHALLARIYSGWGSSKAEEHRRQAEILLRQTAEAYSLRAVVASTPEEALTWLNKALELEPSHFSSRQARALVNYGRRDFARMELDAEAMVVARPQNPLGYTLRAVARQGTDHFEEALGDITRAIRLSRTDAERAASHDRRRALHIQTGRLQPALQDAQRCAQLQPDRFAYHFRVFAALISLGQYDAAMEEYDGYVGADWLMQQQFLRQAKKHMFHLLGAGQSLEIPAESLGHPAFAAMAEAADYFHALKTKATRLVPVTVGHMCWSPDGRQLAYNRAYVYPQEAEALAASTPSMSGPGGIEILDLDSHTSRPLVNFGGDPAWSPDGRSIAFVNTQKETWAGPGDELWIIKTTDGGPRRLASGTWPLWTRDSKRLYFHSRSEGMLYCLRIDETEAEPEPVVPCPGWFPAISPDEKYLAYARGSELRIIEVSTGSVVTTWTAPGHQMDMIVKWSPEGREISVGGMWNSKLGVWIYDLLNREAWHVFDAPAQALIWSPDQSLVGMQINGAYREIWLAAADPCAPTWQALGPAFTSDNYLLRRRAQCVHALEVRRGGADAMLKDLAGVAADQCHLGVYEEALRTLEQVDDWRLTLGIDARPCDLALQLLVLRELGEADVTRAVLERLRLMVQGSLGADSGSVLSTPIPVPSVNYRGGDWSPAIAANSLSLLFASGRRGLGSADLWMATRPTAGGEWSEPVNLGTPVNTAAYEAEPSLSADGLSLYFCDGLWARSVPQRPGGLGGADLWVARRPAMSGAWREPENLGAPVNSRHFEGEPYIAADGLSLLFDSDRPGGLGGSDIWMATRRAIDNPWEEPVNLGPTINSDAWDGGVALSPDGLGLYFSSDRDGGQGSLDIWIVRRVTTEDAWGVPVNLGPLLNSSWEDTAQEVSQDGSTFYFCSKRPGGPGFWDIWQAVVVPISTDLTSPENLTRLAERLVEAEFGREVIPGQN
jgi:serine/threonine protein kinase/tetratricopeptide (TPR) repeat protein/Tol biopolymer transport system component